MYCTLKNRRLMIIMVLLLFSNLTFLGCQKNNSNFRDPFLLFYLRDLPTVKIDSSENVTMLRIDYNNFDKKELSYDDNVEVYGALWHSIYLFEKGAFYGIDYAITNNGVLLRRHNQLRINRSVGGTINSIDQFAERGILSAQHTYKKIDNIIIANDGLRTGAAAAVIVEEESKFKYFSRHQNYSNAPDEPQTIIEFINGDVIVDVYSVISNIHSQRLHYENGILMKFEYINRRTETYTVSSGIGEVIVTDTAGTVTERRFLERRINDAGYLEYEAVRYQNGNGYEYFITKDTF